MGSKIKKSGRKTPRDSKVRDLDCFLNQPNINMTIPWIYEIANTMASSSRDTDEDSKDEIEEDLQCFLNQPNINMTIPWIYQIYKAVKSGGGGGGGEGDSGLDWKDYTRGE